MRQSPREMIRSRAVAPATRADAVMDTYHVLSPPAPGSGTSGQSAAPAISPRHVVDRYRWLEGDNSNADAMGQVTPEVAAWTDAQNAYTRAVLDHLPGRATLEQRLRPLMEVGSVSAPVVRAGRYFYSRREGSQNQPVVYCRDGLHAPDRLLIDPAQLDPTGLTTVEWISPTNDGLRLAYGTYRSGDENTTMHLLDVQSGARLDLEIRNKVRSVAWLPDDTGFVYHNLERADDPYSGRVRFHRLGTDAAGDPVLFRQFTRAENEALATTWGPGATLSRDGRWLLLFYWVDTRSVDLWIADFEAYRRTGRLDRRVVSVGTPGFGAGTVLGGVLYLHTTKGAPRGRVVAAPATGPDEAAWRDVVPERADVVLEGLEIGANCLVVTWLKNASSQVEVFTLDGRSLGLVPLPGIGSAGVAAEEDRTEAFVSFTSFNYPTTIFRTDLASPGAALELWEQPPVPVDPHAVVVTQVWYESRDGTRVSMFLAHRRGLPPTGASPTLLYGYGGFNISLTPAFSAVRLPWFEDGGILAIPNLRGGGEYGDAWHTAGMLERKQNVFDDFIAAAEWLIANDYTCPDRLAIAGGSNGGLLTGAVVTQRPELMRAAIVSVPLLDMLRYHHFLMARYWVPEYGSSDDPALAVALAAYSPYHHVRAGTPYPAVFLTAGEHDTRVHALHARKMAAILQASTASDPADRPILLWVDREAGHGQGKPLNLQLRDVVDQQIFVRWQLDMIDAVTS